MKAVFALWALSGGKGGAERVGSDIVNGLARLGHEITVFVLGEKGNKLCYSLDSRVHVDFFAIRSPGRSDAWVEARRRFWQLAPDVCVVMGSSHALLRGPLLTRGTNIPLILSEHSNPQLIENERWNRADRQAVFSGADRIHLLLESYRDSIHPCLRGRVRIIPNATAMPAWGRASRGNATGASQGGHILAVGRLRDAIKQHSLLVEAMVLLRPLFPSWEAHIWGDGPDKEMLEGRILRHGLERTVFLHGSTENIEREYKRADILCLPSRYEGFPLVLLEAMRHSLPIVGFTESLGVRDVFVPGTGLLAPHMNAQSLAVSLARLMRDAHLRMKLGKNALEASKVFALETVLGKWERLLQETACLGTAALRYPVYEQARVDFRRRLSNAGQVRAAFTAGLEEFERQAADDSFQPLSRSWEIMRQQTLTRLQLAILERSGLFDRQWYRKEYVRGPEIMDPLEHYLRFGAVKGYWPNPGFDTSAYKRKRMGGDNLNPLVHAALWGHFSDYYL